MSEHPHAGCESVRPHTGGRAASATRRIKMGAWHIGDDIALAWHKVRQAIVKKK